MKKWPPGFIWDPRKAQSNLRKHRVSFLEASEVFRDRFGRLRPDPDHEDRWIIVGSSNRDRLLTVVFQELDDTIRLISARRATRRETNAYQEAIQETGQADE
ncbi:MAG: BrnT family toxin [Planctomycetes bacterium]|nr:BrnT family toxin [Planctomycetota bacterium]